MKAKLVSVFLAMFLFLSFFNLKADESKGIYNLKVGDWFEVQCIDTIFKIKSDIHNKTHTYILKYYLHEITENGNYVFRISVLRCQILSNTFHGTYSYDSYYPSISRINELINFNFQYFVEVSSGGKVISIFSESDNSVFKIPLTRLNPNYNYLHFYSHNEILALTKSIENISKYFFYGKSKKDSYLVGKKNTKIFIDTTKNSGEAIAFDSIHFIKSDFYAGQEIPYMVSFNMGQILLTKASFQITGNTMIKGTVNNNTKVKLFINYKKVNTSNTNGLIKCPVMLERPSLLEIQVNEKSFYAFLFPFDTLEFSLSEFPSKNLIYYKGSAAFNSQLINEAYKTIELDNQIYDLDINTYLRKVTLKRKEIESIISENKCASDYCKDFLRNEVNYYLATTKFNYFDRLSFRLNSELQNTSSRNYSINIFQKIPSDFFIEVDTLSVMLNPFKWGNYYNGYLANCNVFKYTRLSMSAGNNDIVSLMNLYNMAKMWLKGYPFYYLAKNLVVNEYYNGYKVVPQIEPFYNEFINNCKDPDMLEELINVHERAVKLEPGKEFPLTEVSLKNNSKLNLEQFKGQPICLIIIPNGFGEMNLLRSFILKHKGKDIRFVFLINNNEGSELPDNDLIKLSNVNVFETNDDFLENELLIQSWSKIIILDKWFRIINDNVENPFYYQNSKEFENSIQEAINTPKYSKEQKASFYKTFGWSLGSILFTVLVGLFIYRNRLKTVRMNEAAKRQVKELEIKAIRSQMNPHFVFNALNSIQSLINSKQIKEANVYLSKFAVLLRQVLNNSEKALVPLSTELETVELYCQLEQLRFNFRFDISIDGNINVNLIEIPGMLIQPLVENAIVHGLSDTEGERILQLDVAMQNEYLKIKVSDNGKGLSHANDLLSQKGFGLKLVQERLQIIQSKNPNAQLKITDKATVNKNTSGVIAELLIPII